MLKKIIFSAILACILLPVQGRAETAEQALQNTIEQLLSILKVQEQVGSEAHARQRQQLRGVIDEIFDYGELSSRTVGLHWKRFTPEEQERFVQAFTTLLSAQYLDRIQAYNNERVEFLGERSSSGGNVEIETRVVQPNRTIPMAYRLKQTDKGWRVYDVIIEGVSLVKNYRSQFTEIMVNGTPEDLIRAVQQRTQQTSSGAILHSVPQSDKGLNRCA
jgi:phospholipid transport system substrate-binding protein